MVLAGQGWAGLGRAQLELELAQLRCNVFGSTIFVRAKLSWMEWVGLGWYGLGWSGLR